MERVEAGQSRVGGILILAPLVCLWILFLQAEEEDASGGHGPSLPRKRYFRRPGQGGQSLLCDFLDASLGGWRRKGQLGASGYSDRV